MSLRSVMVFTLMLCAFIAGLVVELMIAGLDVVYWTFADRGVWLVLWTAIAFICLLIANWRALTIANHKEKEEKNV